MEIKASCIYDEKAITTLWRSSMFNKYNPEKRMKTFGIIALILLILIVGEIIFFAMDSYPITIPVILLIVLLSAAAIFSFMYFKMPKIQYKSMCGFADIKTDFVFTDDKLIVSTSKTDYTGSESIAYPAIYSVKETKNYFFIYIDKGRAFSLDKSTIENGTVEDIQKIFMPLLGKKYVYCDY